MSVILNQKTIEISTELSELVATAIDSMEDNDFITLSQKERKLLDRLYVNRGDDSPNTAALQITYHRLLEKGVCYEQVIELLYAIMNETRTMSLWLSGFFGMDIMQEIAKVNDLTIPQEIWIKAIEKIILTYHEQELLNDDTKNYTLLIKGHESELRFTALMMFYGDSKQKYSEFGKSESQSTAKNKQLTADLANAHTRIEELERQLKETQSELTEARSAQQASTNKIAELQKNMTAAAVQNQKRILAIEHENQETLETSLVETNMYRQQAEILTQILCTYEDGLDDDSSVMPIRELDDSETESIELPTENVLFLGGHRNMVRKVEQLYPNWTFINGESNAKGLMIRKNYQVIFFWTNHISHGLQQCLFQNMGYEAPIIYVTATNMNLLVSQMKAGFSEATGISV